MRKTLISLILSSVVALNLTGCVGQQAAVDVADRLSAASDDVMATLKSLETAVLAREARCEKSREVLGSALDHLLHEGAKAAVEVEYYKARGKVENAAREEYRFILTSGAELLARFHTLLAEKLDEAYKREAVLAEAAKKAKSELDGFPGDRDLKTALDTADRRYLAFAGELREIELEAYDRFLSSVDEARKAAAARLQSATDEHLTSLQATYTDGLREIGAIETALDLGDEPSDLGPVFELILDYATAVKAAQAAFKAYLAASTWNPFRNTIIRELATSAFRSFKQELLDDKSSGPPDWKAVAASGKAIVTEEISRIKEELRTSAAESVAALKAESGRAVDLLKELAAKEVSDELDKLREKVSS